MSKNGAYPGRHATIEEYKRLYIAALESGISDPIRLEFRAFRDKVLKDSSLGISAKHLERAEDSALIARRGKMVGSNR